MLLNLMKTDKYLNLVRAAFIAYAIGGSLHAHIMSGKTDLLGE